MPVKNCLQSERFRGGRGVQWRWEGLGGGGSVNERTLGERGETAVGGLRAKVGVGVTVSKPQERRRKAVNGSSPCLNRL